MEVLLNFTAGIMKSYIFTFLH